MTILTITQAAGQSVKGILQARPNPFYRYSLGIREAVCSCQFGRFVKIRFGDPIWPQGHRRRDLLGQLVNSYSGIAAPLCIADLARSIGHGARVVGGALCQQKWVRLGVRRTKCTAGSTAEPMVDGCKPLAPEPMAPRAPQAP